MLNIFSRSVYRGAVEVQNQIKRALSEQNSIELVRGLLSEDAYAHRSTFADAVCQHFGFHDARGRLQRSGCIKALRELERSGHAYCPLPAPGGPKERKRSTNPRLLNRS